MSEICPTVEVTRSAVATKAACEPISGHADQFLAQPAALDKVLLPSFLVVGPPRTGSSWLHEVLRLHTLLPSPSKETRFFDTHFQRGVKWYLAHYESAVGEPRMGEVAPTYFASASARERIALTIPRAKIVCVFRNPVDRIFPSTG